LCESFNDVQIVYFKVIFTKSKIMLEIILQKPILAQNYFSFIMAILFAELKFLLSLFLKIFFFL